MAPTNTGRSTPRTRGAGVVQVGRHDPVDARRDPGRVPRPRRELGLLVRRPGPYDSVRAPPHHDLLDRGGDLERPDVSVHAPVPAAPRDATVVGPCQHLDSRARRHRNRGGRLRDGSNPSTLVGSFRCDGPRGVFPAVLVLGRRSVPPARFRTRRVWGVLLDLREDEGPCVGGAPSPLSRCPRGGGLGLSRAPPRGGAPPPGPAPPDPARAPL